MAKLDKEKEILEEEKDIKKLDAKLGDHIMYLLYKF